MKGLLSTLVLVIASSLITLQAQSYYISTIAGTGTFGYAGAGTAAISAKLYYPCAVAVDTIGNVYVADYDNFRVRKINVSGIISVFAGTGTAGCTDGISSFHAEINKPTGIAMDDSGNLFIADPFNYRIRKVNAHDTISTYAGNGMVGDSGDGGKATLAKLDFPIAVAADHLGNIYIADALGNRIRKVNKHGIISTFAGNGTPGYTGDGGQAVSAELNYPYGVAVDGSGNVYIADNANNCIRKVNTSGVISTFVGTGVAGYSGDGAAASAAQLNEPQGVAFDPRGNMYITDHNNQCVRQVNAFGVISTFAGSGVKGFSGDKGVSTSAELNGPAGTIGFDPWGNAYIADQNNQRIRRLSMVTGVNEISVEGGDVIVYPNPGKGVFTFEINNEKSVINNTIEVYNMLGEKVYNGQLTVNNEKFSIDLSTNAKGVYLYRIISQAGQPVSSGKLVIE